MTSEQLPIVYPEERPLARRGGLPLDLIRLFLGHTDVKTTERYSKHHNGALVALVRRGK